MQDIKNISEYRQSLKDKILETAMTSFKQKGIRAVKMDDIATSLSISKRTLYEVYENKEALLAEGVRKYKKERMEQMTELAAQCDNVMDIIIKSFRVKLEDFRLTSPAFFFDLLKYPRIVKSFEEDNKADHNQVVKFFERGIREGFFLDGVNYELAVHMLDALNKYIISNQIYRKYSIEDMFFNLIFVSVRGFCTQKGIEMLDNSFLKERVQH